MRLFSRPQLHDQLDSLADRWGGFLIILAIALTAASLPLASLLRAHGVLAALVAGGAMIFLASAVHAHAAAPSRAHPYRYAVVGLAVGVCLLVGLTPRANADQVAGGCFFLIPAAVIAAAYGARYGGRRVMPPIQAGTCHQCGYRTAGLPFPGRCPECGATVLARPHDRQGDRPLSSKPPPPSF